MTVPIDDLRRVFYEHNLCRLEAGVEDAEKLLDKIKKFVEALEAARPIVKRAAVYGSETALAALDKIAEALN